MIGRQDILDRVREWGLRAETVEKDYVLGWLLAAIGQHPETKDAWVFKGGTCLKKCYFETYRFSEDIDFSLLPVARWSTGVRPTSSSAACAGGSSGDPRTTPLSASTRA